MIQLLAVVLYGCGTGAAQSTYKVINGQAIEENGRLIAKNKVVVDFPFAPPAEVVTVRGRTGKSKAWTSSAYTSIGIEYLDRDGKPITGADGKARTVFYLSAKDHNKRFPDAQIACHWPGAYYIRPNVSRLDAATQKKLAAQWSALPAASEHEFRLEFHRAGEAFQVWFDGQFMDEIAAPPAIGGFRIALAPGASLSEVSAHHSTSDALLTLPIAEYSGALAIPDAQIVFDSKDNLPATFQKLDGAPASGVSLNGAGRLLGIGAGELQSLYWGRHASDNLPGQVMFSVPMATYDRAEVLCALEDDTSKPNTLTLRVTRYANSRGNAMADTIVTVPRTAAESTPHARRVGSVSYGPAGARRTAPLWLISVPIKNGLIQDLLYDDTRRGSHIATHKYLDVELQGGGRGNVEIADAFPPPLRAINRSRAVQSASCGAMVFGVALHQSPAQMQVRSNPAAQAFYASDKPQFDATVEAAQAGEYSVRWEYADVDGKIAGSGTKSVKLDAGKTSTLSAPVAVGVGWYAARFRLSNGNDELIDYRTSFVMLPPDTRRAGLESPFYGWTFGANHGSQPTLEEMGPLFKRLGMRRVELAGDMTEKESLPRYGFTDSTIPWTSKFYGELYAGKTDLAGAIAQHEAFIRAQLEKAPSMDRMLVFHESGSTTGAFPTELIGITPPPLKPDVAERMQFKINYLTALAKMVRAKFPQIKLQYGNDGNSLRLVGELLRAKLPREYIDTISSEDLGQTIAPERTMLGGTQDGFYLRELARKMDYGDVPVTACTEWIGRMTEKLGLCTQAEWKVRDGLLALAYGYDTISIAGLNDASDGYYYSIWANGGLTTRWPLLAPKPAYAAIATLTQVLDRAQYQRFVPTGSTVLYVQEFKRGDEWVYALWTPRGERELTLQFPDNTPRSLVDLYGRETAANGARVLLKANTAPQYLVSKTQLASVAAGASTFPQDKAKVPAKPQQVIAMESAASLAIVPDAGTARQGEGWARHLSGPADLREVDDAEMGKCLEVELKPVGELRLGDVEYVTLRFSQPIPVTTQNAGIWIKGNGSWGEVDLTGARLPWKGNGNLDTRWRGDLTTNFDGWNFLAFPGGKRPDKPMSLTGLRLTLPRETLVGPEMTAVPTLKIRLKRVVLF
jgi:hypothetical protein